MQTNLYLWLIPLLPLIGAAWNGICARRRSESHIAAVAIAAVALAFALGVRALLLLGSSPVVEAHQPWIAAGAFRADFSFYWDALAAIMTLVVTGVGLLIHIYAVGYMAREKGYYRFFACMNLFVFFMLLLVLADNYLLLFAGWEGVGLCSYLLIGFYFQKPEAADAGKKAFLVNRVGDFGFLIALLLLFRTFHSLNFTEIFTAAALRPVEAGWLGPLTLICLLMLMGATGKSAQVPLYVWLPDAMAGPTPVSALIHAATMVTAGVYMIARSGVLFVHAPQALLAVAVIGAVTCLYAATIAILQTDIKRILAYSTISQIGYMVMACGVAAFSAAIFHLMTHAFFKALLFLGAGSVIHGLGGQQDIHNMGGLRRYMPRTYISMLAACLAISAIPPFSGFFSKDAILWGAFTSSYGGLGFWVIGVITAGLTSFYMFRLFFLTFHGESRWKARQDTGIEQAAADQAHTPGPAHAAGQQSQPGIAHRNPHESPGMMSWPMMILALLSLIGGWIGIPESLGGADRFGRFLAPVFQVAVPATAVPASHGGGFEMIASLIALGVSLAGIGLAYLFYVRRPELAPAVAARFGGLYKLITHKYYVDEVYGALFVRPLVFGSREVLWKGVEQWAIDGAVNQTAREIRAWGNLARRLQSGNLRSYAAWVALGAVVLMAFLMAVAG